MASRPKNAMADYVGNKEKEATFNECVELLVYKQEKLNALKKEMSGIIKECALKLNLHRGEIIDEVRFRCEV